MADENVQLALIVQKLDGLIHDIAQSIDEQRRINVDHENRLRNLEKSVTQMGERLTLWQTGQAFFTTVAATLAALFGVNK